MLMQMRRKQQEKEAEPNWAESKASAQCRRKRPSYAAASAVALHRPISRDEGQTKILEKATDCNIAIDLGNNNK